FPFRPVPDVIDVPKDDAEKDDLAAEPKDLHNHPQEEIRLETHLANKRVAHHDGVDFDVAPHWISLSPGCRRVNYHIDETICPLDRFGRRVADCRFRGAALPQRAR